MTRSQKKLARLNRDLRLVEQQYSLLRHPHSPPPFLSGLVSLSQAALNNP